MDNIIKGLLDSLSLSDGLSVRQDCPYCGGRNTFTLVKDRNELKWNCFKLGCRVKGRAGAELSKTDVLSALDIIETNHEQLQPLPHWVAPNAAMIKWMRLWGVLRAVEGGRLRGMYDPKENRYVFLAYQEGRLVAAQGRAASGSSHMIKWKHYYGRVRAPFIIPQVGTYMRPEYHAAKVGIIVEDITSAAVVSEYADGIALMGTSLLEDYFPILGTYDKVVIHLDKDANSKALDMTGLLTWHTKATMVMAEKDPKNMNGIELGKLYGSIL